MLERGYERVRVRIPYDQTALVDLFHRKGTIATERHTDKGTLITGSLPAALRGTLPALRRALASRLKTISVLASHVVQRLLGEVNAAKITQQQQDLDTGECSAEMRPWPPIRACGRPEQRYRQ